MSGPGASHRSPWARGGLYGLVAALAPFAWVLEVDGCGEAPVVTTELTGLEVVGRLDPGGVAIVVPVLAIAVLAPFFATKLTAGWGALVQLLGLAATGFVAYVAWFLLFFALFTERTLRPAGWAVAAAVCVTVLEALLRVTLGAREWWVQRRSAPPG